jgi:hypothetical protein
MNVMYKISIKFMIKLKIKLFDTVIKERDIL